LTDVQHGLLQDAIGYWNDAMAEATSNSESNNAKQAASAMCGPHEDGGSGPKSPIGLDVREVPNVKIEKENAIKKSTVEGEEVLGERLKVYMSKCICKSVLKSVYAYSYIYMYTKSAVEGEEVLGKRLEVYMSKCICKSMLKSVYAYSYIYICIQNLPWRVKRFWGKDWRYICLNVYVNLC
jgi:hypothetical protein